MFTHNTKFKFAIGFALLGFVLIPQYLLAQTNPNAGIEEFVRLSFTDAPDMVTIAKCESGFRQFRSEGVVLRGGSGQYVGIFQIDENIHTARALQMGYDIQTIAGNINYAHYLYSTSGTNPWKGCIGTTTPAPAPVVTPLGPVTPNPVNSGVLTITGNLDSGQTSSQIIILQQILNRSGFVVAASGAGSMGNETTYFGNLTRVALMKFQCSKGIVCSGSASSTGYGRVGPRTRVVLNQTFDQ